MRYYVAETYRGEVRRIVVYADTPDGKKAAEELFSDLVHENGCMDQAELDRAVRTGVFHSSAEDPWVIQYGVAVEPEDAP